MKHMASCHCGAIKLEISGDLPQPDACHCTKCRKTTGHYLVSTDVKKKDLTYLSGQDKVSWYQSSEKVKRGFCSNCGSALFFDAIFKDWIGVSMGAFDTPTQTTICKHIFVANKGDYYEIKDGIPQNEH